MAFEQLGFAGDITVLLSDIQHPAHDQNNPDRDNILTFLSLRRGALTSLRVVASAMESSMEMSPSPFVQSK